MRTIVHFIVTIAAAGVAGSALAGATVGAARMDVVTKKSGQGQTATVPDVSKTPAGPAPFVPIPYPNMGQGEKESQKKAPKSALKNKSTFKQSTGDEAGTVGGVVSSKNMDKVEGKLMLTPLDGMTNNKGGSANPPPGVRVAPSQTKVLIEGKVAPPVQAKPRTPVDTGVQPIAPGALPAPAVLQPSAPLTPVARPALQPAPLPAKVEPVKVPQPVVVQPVQPTPVLQTQPVLRR